MICRAAPIEMGGCQFLAAWQSEHVPLGCRDSSLSLMLDVLGLLDASMLCAAASSVVTFLGCYVDGDMELNETLCGRGHLRRPAQRRRGSG